MNELIVRVIEWAIDYISSRDDEYQSMLALTNHRHDYLTFRKHLAEWHELEKKHGTWSETYASNPDAVLRLEELLA